jgi:hypothetical protein
MADGQFDVEGMAAQSLAKVFRQTYDLLASTDDSDDGFTHHDAITAASAAVGALPDFIRSITGDPANNAATGQQEGQAAILADLGLQRYAGGESMVAALPDEQGRLLVRPIPDGMEVTWILERRGRVFTMSSILMLPADIQKGWTEGAYEG